jgi:SP family general alpha glucoside:H+ symporter-like MFS transporter
MDSRGSKDTPQHVEVVNEAGPADEEVGKAARQNRIDADLATQDEHEMTFLAAVKRYPKACAWSAIVSLAIIMDGYDLALMGGLFGFPAFQKAYGHQVGNTGRYTLSAQWQMALGMAVPVGNFVGVALNGSLTERFGHKPVLLCGLTVLTGLIFIQFFAKNVETLFVGQILCGVPWGMFTTLAPAFSSEVVPLALRSYLETWVVTCWGIGQFFSYAVLFSLNEWDSDWAYRIPFAVQWAWPAIIIPLAAFCPESPWWYVRKGRIEKAHKSVRRLTNAKSRETAQAEVTQAVALMIETNKLEQDETKDAHYQTCFKGDNLWRTEVACFTWGSQILTGYAIQAYAAYFFQQAGLSPNDSFKMTLGMGGIHFVCNLASAALSGSYGRRTLYLNGCIALTVMMFILGGLAFGPRNSAYGFATSAVYLVWYGIWCLTLGPLPYVINGEVSSTRLRSKTIALARSTYLVLNIINSVSTPYILNPEWADWGGKTGLLTGSLTIVSFVWAYFRLPETGGRTYEELDILFAQKNMTARKFGKAVIHREGDLAIVTGPGLQE